MGYTTTFEGSFTITPTLKKEDHEFLMKLAGTRRMQRKLGPEFGIEGEFFVDGQGMAGQADTPDVIDHNKPPKTQPGLWCQWIPNDDGTELMWDEGEKFYSYDAWLLYLVDRILKPRGYTLDGEVSWRGEDDDDRGVLSVKKNKVFKQVAKPLTYDKPTRVQWVGPGEAE